MLGTLARHAVWMPQIGPHRPPGSIDVDGLAALPDDRPASYLGVDGGARVDIGGYLKEVRRKHDSGHATEHSYRPALEALFCSISDSISVVNEPKKSEAGMPDFLFERGGVPFGWAEAKALDKDIIRLKGYSVEQRSRYVRAYPNLIYTNGVDFEFIRDGVSVHIVSVADISAGFRPIPERFDELRRQLELFAEQRPISVRSADKLAQMMAAKAAIIKDEIGIALADDRELRSSLGGQFRSFRSNLLPHLSQDEFSDIYAETITYGMFAARYHDGDLSTFSRQEAMDNLPASNPFLKGLFEYIAGPALPKRLEYIVDDLVHLMRASDPQDIFRDFGRFAAGNDPFIHFYEDFLAAYNPAKRKSRGVWYTPEPVVDFIVRAVDEVLRQEFRISDGLADTTKVEVDWDTGQDDPKSRRPRVIRKNVHRVQILDPATGTGTFLAKTVQVIADRVKRRASGKWSGYIEQELLPRLHGFELLMASYAMCHMKLDMQLSESGYRPSANPPRLSVWLTNALEPAEREIRDLFFQPLAEEARGAGDVKRQTPIMCVIGNPPYSGHSSNFSPWIENLMDTYKVSAELKRPAQAKWLSDDYVKFIRMSESLIERSGEGVLGFVTNHSYLDNPTFMDMRRSLQHSFDDIFILDLHGNSKKKEVAPDGSPDRNVFDIQQGVAIIIAVRRQRTAKKVTPARVRRADLWGTRDIKYEALRGNLPSSLKSVDVTPKASPWRFQVGDGDLEAAYGDGFSLETLFSPNGRPAPGMVTTQDEFAISWSRSEVEEKVAHFVATRTEAEARQLFRLCSQSQWNYDAAKAELKRGKWRGAVIPVHYRPLDDRFTIFNSHVAVHRRERATRHLVGHDNLALAVPRQTRDAVGAWVLKYPSTHKIFAAYDINFIFPLYLYSDPESRKGGALTPARRTLNLDPKTFSAICKRAKLDPRDVADSDRDPRLACGQDRSSEIKVFDYIYAVLHCRSYLERFESLLKTDFPRIPYPSTPAIFRRVSEQGESLRRLHLMEPVEERENLSFPFNGDGDDVVSPGFPRLRDDNVFISESQAFSGVTQELWSHRIGGYMPAQKWLKDRRGMSLSFEDVRAYQGVLEILAATITIERDITI